MGLIRVLKVGLLLLCIFLVCTAENCTDGPIDKPELHTFFSGPFPKKGTDLTRVLGSDITVKSNFVVRSYHLEYYKADRTTLITGSNGDTVYNGVVSKYRGLYFFHKEVAQDQFHIGALYVKDSQITGFLNIEKQMHRVQDSMEHYKNAELSQRPDYLVQLSDSFILLETSKRPTYKLFNELLESTSPDVFRPLNEVEAPLKTLDSTEADNSEQLEKAELVARFGLMPSTEELRILLKNKEPQAQHVLYVHDLNGKELYQKQVKGAIHAIATSQWPEGTYVFSIISNQQKWAKQFVVAH